MKKRLLLLTFSVCAICFFQNSYAQNLLTESFDDLSFFPPTGWTNTNFQSFGGFGLPDWEQGTGEFTYPYNVSPHSGAGMAWYNMEGNYPGSSAELATPQITIPTTAGGFALVSFWCFNYIPSFTTYNQEIDVYINSQNTASSGSPQMIGSVFPNAGTTTGWVKYSFVVPTGTNGAQYVIFNGLTVNYYGPDVFLDDVSIDFFPPCSGTPPVGTLGPTSVCSGVNFTLTPNDTAVAGSITYGWQSSNDGVNWNTISGATHSTYTTSITSPEYYRMIANCTISGVADTTPADYVTLNPFYLCYCNDSNSNASNEANIGNVLIQSYPGNAVLLNNGNPFPTTGNAAATNNYSNFGTLPPASLFLDSVYQFVITQTQTSTSWNNSPVNIYIDYNRDGVYQPSELVFNQETGSSSQSVSDTVRIPQNAQTGLTGMRVILQPFQSTPLSPCTQYTDGEVEDYVVNISYDPCNGPVYAGVASTTDTTLCPGLGYSVFLSDVTHERNQGNLQWGWEQSPDNGVTWGPVANTANQDTVTLLYNLPVWYRMRITCTSTNVNSYSNVLKIKSDPGYACYCYSQAIGGAKFDSSDIGAFGMGKYVFNDNNSINNAHLDNPGAVRGHSDYSPYIMDFAEDSTYHVFAYHIMKSLKHADAKVTMFIDYNNNLTYDIPDERVWTAYTTADSFFLTTDITIPHTVVTGVPTGMRIIINNNVSANIPSDDACGPYTSGETEDFVVYLHDSSTASVGNIQDKQAFLMYPNPTTGNVRVVFNASKPVKQMSVRVSNVTGQQVLTKEYVNVGSQFSTSLDLTAQPRGIYFVEFLTDGERTIRKLTLE